MRSVRVIQGHALDLDLIRNGTVGLRMDVCNLGDLGIGHRFHWIDWFDLRLCGSRLFACNRRYNWLFIDYLFGRSWTFQTRNYLRCFFLFAMMLFFLLVSLLFMRCFIRFVMDWLFVQKFTLVAN